jgi:hypothetical protein
MTQAESVLITSRRNFIVRALGFTAAGATMAVPVLAVSSVQDRIRHHLKGLEAAYRDLYPGAPVVVRSLDAPAAAVIDREVNEVAVSMVLAGPMSALDTDAVRPGGVGRLIACERALRDDVDRTKTFVANIVPASGRIHRLFEL